MTQFIINPSGERISVIIPIAEYEALKRINLLIKDTQRTPFEGIGKSEPLRHELSGFWSRRIDEANRLVYVVENGVFTIIECRGHYSNDSDSFGDHYQQVSLRKGD